MRLLKNAARPGGTGVPKETAAEGGLLEAFVELMMDGYLQYADSEKCLILTPEGEEALKAAEAREKAEGEVVR